MAMMLSAKSASAEVTFDGRSVTIRKRLAAGPSTKTISVDSIAAVQWKAPGLRNGFLEFTVPGAVERRQVTLESENGVIVRLGNVKPFLEIRDAVNAAIAARGSTAPQTQSEPRSDAADQLRKLAELHQLGVVSDQEFEAKKSELLNRM